MSKYALGFSVVASFTGEHPDLMKDYYPCDTTLRDVIREWPVKGELEPSEPFDSEYNYLAREGNEVPRKVLDRLEEAAGETKFQMCRAIREKYDRTFWTRIADVQGSGIFDRKTLFGFLDSIGAYFEDCGTMGTLGGPLGIGIVPDFAFNVESQCLIASIRITPILCRVEGKELIPCRPPCEWQWNCLAEIFRNSDCYALAKGGAK